MKKFLQVSLITSLSLALVACSGEEAAPAENNLAQEGPAIENAAPTEEDTPDQEATSYQWMGLYSLEEGQEYSFHFGENPHATETVAFIPVGEDRSSLDQEASQLMAGDKKTLALGALFEMEPKTAYSLEMDPDHGHFNFTVPETGDYALVLQYSPLDNDFALMNLDHEDIAPQEILQGDEPLHDHEGHDHDHEGHDHEDHEDHDHEEAGQ
ncbi:MAG: hypothetical protein Q4E37_05465 [Tissierellia bacterium]|nr:hypothetical protein [Tissierellia bacterium]